MRTRYNPYRRNTMKNTPFTKELLERISKEYPTPFYLYNEKGIRETARRLKKAFSWNPGFREYFAVKALPNPQILKILKEEGCGTDCSSYTELLLAEKCGFHDTDIMFSSNDTQQKDYVLADQLKAYINLDDISHITDLKNCLPRFPETVCLRYNPGGVFTLGETAEGFQVMDCPEESKFGMRKDQIFEAVRILQKEGVRHFGLHAFLASNTISDDYYPAVASVLFQLAVQLKKETGCHISFINLSGGIGIPYRPEDRENDIEIIADGVRKAYEEILIPSGMNDVRIFTELGRYMTGPHGYLITRVIHIKNTYRTYIGTDASAADLLRPAMYGAYHHITAAGKEDMPLTMKADVTGSLCENNDKFAVQRDLPQIETGDLLIIHDAGAHSRAMGFNYNGALRCGELLLKEDGTIKEIRRKETPEDYFSTMIFD